MKVLNNGPTRCKFFRLQPLWSGCTNPVAWVHLGLMSNNHIAPLAPDTYNCCPFSRGSVGYGGGICKNEEAE